MCCGRKGEEEKQQGKKETHGAGEWKGGGGRLAQAVVEREELLGELIAAGSTQTVELTTGFVAAPEVEEQGGAVHLQRAVVGTQTEQVLESFECGDFVTLALCKLGADGQRGLVIGMPKQGGAEMEQRFVAVALSVKL